MVGTQKFGKKLCWLLYDVLSAIWWHAAKNSISSERKKLMDHC